MMLCQSIDISCLSTDIWQWTVDYCWHKKCDEVEYNYVMKMLVLTAWLGSVITNPVGIWDSLATPSEQFKNTKEKLYKQK